jgi:hypothetical protein
MAEGNPTTKANAAACSRDDLRPYVRGTVDCRERANADRTAASRSDPRFTADPSSRPTDWLDRIGPSGSANCTGAPCYVGRSSELVSLLAIPSDSPSRIRHLRLVH